jgi:hypothetical protein
MLQARRFDLRYGGCKCAVPAELLKRAVDVSDILRAELA